MLGHLNYNGLFLFNLADLTHPLRPLAKKNIKWVWGFKEQVSLDSLKTKLLQVRKLAFFDGAKQQILTLDVFPVRLGVIHSHRKRKTQMRLSLTRVGPALSPTKSWYSQIERELLALVRGIDHIHLYVYVNTFSPARTTKHMYPPH